ncbi:MAG: phosphotransferase [Legionellales bacterium]|jgi:N-acetylmuramate 1-kinase|nr:phosphotransferase [Legionellales bacterium]
MSATITPNKNKVLYTIGAWVKRHINENHDILPINGDAGARNYYRIKCAGTSYILMHDPDETQLSTYIESQQKLTHNNITTPTILAYDINKRLLLQTDFGDNLLAKIINPNNKSKYYKMCIDNIISMQTKNSHTWPQFNSAKLQQETTLPIEWYCNQQCSAPLNDNEIQQYNKICTQICKIITKIETTFVHRDYHSRNIFITDGNVQIIDFQDAVTGPFNYDLVSLLRDYYQPLSNSLVSELIDYYHNTISDLNIANVSHQEFVNIFHITALQRHLKVLGIFCRLKHRDNKDNYIKYLPTVKKYIKDVIKNKPEYADLIGILKL